MGPFVPDFISDQLNLIIALVLGIGFGFVLEQAGFSSSRRLAGVFYGYDFTVLRVFFSAAVTAMTGIVLLGYFGLLDTEAIYVNPTWLVPAIVGGVIMGLGFIVGGYCPGTGICAAAIGKIDAMFFVGGGIIGVFFFAELYPFYKHFYDSTSLGSIKVFDSIGISQGLFAFLLIVIAVGAFMVTTVIEKKVDKKTAPSLKFKPMKHVAAGALAVAVAVLLLVLPDRKIRLIETVSGQAYRDAHPVKIMDTDELAFRIVDHETNIQVVDFRTGDAYSKLALPGSLNIPLRGIFDKEWVPMLSRRHLKKVIVADSEAEEKTAALLVSELGYENVAILKGGIGEFTRNILSQSDAIPVISRWDADVNKFRTQAGTEIRKMISDQKNAVPKGPKKEKKIQGGC